MPAKSKKQLRKAHAEVRKGHDGFWRELIEKTPSTKGLPMRAKKGKK